MKMADSERVQHVILVEHRTWNVGRTVHSKLLHEAITKVTTISHRPMLSPSTTMNVESITSSQISCKLQIFVDILDIFKS